MKTSSDDRGAIYALAWTEGSPPDTNGPRPGDTHLSAASSDMSAASSDMSAASSDMCAASTTISNDTSISRPTNHLHNYCNFNFYISDEFFFFFFFFLANELFEMIDYKCLLKYQLYGH